MHFQTKIRYARILCTQSGDGWGEIYTEIFKTSENGRNIQRIRRQKKDIKGLGQRQKRQKRELAIPEDCLGLMLYEAFSLA